MTDTTDETESSGQGSKAILGIAAVACVACCIGPILAVLGGSPRSVGVDHLHRGSRVAACRRRRCCVHRRATPAPCERLLCGRTRTGPRRAHPKPAVNRLLRRTAAALFVVAAALLVVGVSTEDSHSETGESVHDESAEATGSDECNRGKRVGEPPSADTPRCRCSTRAGSRRGGAAARHRRRVTPAVTAAVIVSLALAVGLWLRNRRWLAIVAVGVGVEFAVFDIAEILHQLEESHTGLTVLAAVVATAHLTAAVTASLSTRAAGPA